MKHGGDLTEAEARHGGGDPPWLDLSTGINPHPWPVPDALRRTGWERLPGGAEMDVLLGSARAAYRVTDGAGIVAAPGTQALIQWLPRLAPPGAVSILGPTYAEHEASWRGAGRDVAPTFVRHPSGVMPRSPEGGHLEARTDDVARASGRAFGSPQHDAREGPSHEIPPVPDSDSVAIHRVVVNPNNPDGRVVGLGTLREIAEACASAGGWLIVDEAFADLDPGMSAAGLVPELPVIVLRSFGKFYGLAGLRLGFAIAPPAIAASLREALGDWAVSGPALAVGTAALADDAWAKAMRLRLAAEAAALDGVLTGGGLERVGGTSLYRLVRHPGAAAIHECLAAAHIWCRRFDWAPDLLRFGLPPDAEGLACVRDALQRHVQGTRITSPATSAR